MYYRAIIMTVDGQWVVVPTYKVFIPSASQLSIVIINNMIINVAATRVIAGKPR